MTLPNSIKHYLNARGISDNIIEKQGLSWEGAIVIPVRDSAGGFLFNKYRRDPSLSEGAKYSYDKGASATLYNSETLCHATSVIITEGELDALVLESAGLHAVSSTGGSGTFKKEWYDLFREKEVFICYDNDEAGVSGAIKVAAIIPHAKIIELPDFGGVKDVTDFFTFYQHNRPLSKFTLVMAGARTYSVPGENAKIAELKERLDDLIAERRRILNEGGVSRITDHIINIVCDSIELKKKKAAPVGPAFPVSRIEQAKSVPITDLLQFNRDGFTFCIWHTEETPSMHYYKEKNIVKCFGCGEYGDVIAVYRQLHKLGMKEALDFLAPKK